MKRNRIGFRIVTNDLSRGEGLGVVLQERGHSAEVLRSGMALLTEGETDVEHYILDWSWVLLREFVTSPEMPKPADYKKVIVLLPEEDEEALECACPELKTVKYDYDDLESVADDIEASLGMRRRVLLVDDDEDLREMCSEILGEYYEVDEAPNPVEAISMLNETAADYVAVVTDVMMPLMSGTEFVDYIANEFPELPVVVITGYPSKELIQKTEQAGKRLRGGIRVLSKPFSIDQLLNATKFMSLKK